MSDVDFSRIPDDAARRWRVVRDVCAGDQALRNDRYLPYLNAKDISEENVARNVAYRQRAVFYNATGRTRAGLLGLAFRRDPRNQMPNKLGYLLGNVDGAGMSLYQQSQATLANTIEVGRHGLYTDFDERLRRPVIKVYRAEDIINWRHIDGRLTLVVLHEVAEEPDGFGFKAVSQFRELALQDGRFVCRIHRKKDKEWDVREMRAALPNANQQFDFLPFTFVGSRDNGPDIDEAPLYDLSQVNVAHFRNSADYEDSVFFIGQAQPWISGLTEEWRDHLESNGNLYVGSRVPILLPEGGAFGFAQVAPNTLAREAMDQKEKQMVALGARLLDETRAAVTATQNENDKETSTSVLSMCVSNVSEAYERAIAWCGLYAGVAIPEDAETYRINQEFAKNKIDPTAITALVQAWQSGAFAKPDLRAYLRAEGVIAVERTDEDIDADLELEGPALGTIGREDDDGDTARRDGQA